MAILAGGLPNWDLDHLPNWGIGHLPNWDLEHLRALRPQQLEDELARQPAQQLHKAVEALDHVAVDAQELITFLDVGTRCLDQATVGQVSNDEAPHLARRERQTKRCIRRPIDHHLDAPPRGSTAGTRSDVAAAGDSCCWQLAC